MSALKRGSVFGGLGFGGRRSYAGSNAREMEHEMETGLKLGWAVMFRNTSLVCRNHKTLFGITRFLIGFSHTWLSVQVLGLYGFGPSLHRFELVRG